MPSYEYKCSCGEHLEITHSMSEKLTPVCEKCGKRMIRDYRFGAVTFKGDGWGKDA